MPFFKSLLKKLGHSKDVRAESKVKGFDVSIEKKEGVLLTTRSESGPNAQKKDASINEFYEVAVRINGNNPEYPAQQKPWITRFTVSTDSDSGTGFIKGTSYIPNRSKWTGFELVEKFDDASTPPTFGKWMPAHHKVILTGHFQNADGKESSTSLGGGWVRKSEKESDKWKAAASSPVTFM